MSRPRGRIPVYTDSLSERVTRHVDHLEASKLVEQSGYEYIDSSNPRRGITVSTVDIPLRPQIACTISLSETMINAGANAASVRRIESVRTKIAHYNDDDLKREITGTYCLLPLSLKHKSIDGIAQDAVIEHTENYVTFH